MGCWMYDDGLTPEQRLRLADIEAEEAARIARRAKIDRLQVVVRRLQGRLRSRDELVAAQQERIARLERMIAGRPEAAA